MPSSPILIPEQVTEALDALPRLDHRSRRRAVEARDAGPGRYLSVDDGDERRLVPITSPVTHIGRAFTADLRLEDPSVSRRHAILVERAGGVRILDDRSVNGTYVNGRRVSEAELTDGDVLVLGTVVLTYTEVLA